MAKYKVAVCATTGMAVKNLHITGATTIHHWAGLIDGRYSNAELIKRLDDEYSCDILSRVRAADILIIDEISMLSARLFEQLHLVCSYVRKTDKIFGGIQLICVGDFRQLPPVPNNAYNDSGRYAFQSDLWNSAMSHVVMLTARKRQTKELSECVDKILCNAIDETTRVFMANLQRPLPTSSMGKIVH